MSVRRTLGLATGLLVVASGAFASSADLVLLNGRIYTLDPRQPWAEALAARGEEIVAVGTSRDIRRLVGPATRVVDLRGRFALPGFNDAHVHVDATGALLTGVNLLDVHEGALFRERIAGAAARLPRGAWITRGDWGAYESWGKGSAGARGRAAASSVFTPDRRLIDDVTPDHPVFVSRFDRKVHLANAKALVLAGVTAETGAPPGGHIARDDAGRLTGVLEGAAAELVRAAIPPLSFEERLVNVRAVLAEARRSGVTTVQDLTSGPQLQAYQELRRRGELTLRINVRPYLSEVPHVAALGFGRGFGDDWLRLVGYKAWVDGIMGNSGALFFAPYDHDPGNKGYLRHVMFPEGVEGAGLSMTADQRYTDFPPGNLEKLLEQAVATGVPPHVHAIGDKGVRILLDVYEKVLRKNGLLDKDHRWRVIHGQVVHPSDFPRFGALRLVAEVNPFHVSDDMRWMEERIGRERSRGAYAFRTLKESGATLVFGSDSPGTNAARYYLSPVYGLYAAVTRQTLKGEPADGWFPAERLTIEEAIEAATKSPAWAAFEEGRKGTLTAGRLADVSVWDADLVDAGRRDPRRLLEAKVVYTVVGGKVVHEPER
jgi:predicted amidohydrolase YtcJ